MLISTRGIVLYQADYSETSLIVKIFTEEAGLQSYIVKGVRKKGSRIKRNLFGPLSVVEMVAYIKETNGLHMIREVSCFRQFPVISSDIRKSSVLLFMNELVYRSIPAEMTDKRLFSFLFDSLIELESIEDALAVFPVVFSLRMADLLGFLPQNNFSAQQPYFDLAEGSFAATVPIQPHYMEPGMSRVFSDLLSGQYSSFEAMAHDHRFYLLQKVLDYFRLHLTGFGELKSHQVLSTVLRD